MTQLKTSALLKCPKCELNFLSKEGMEKHLMRIHETKSKEEGTRFKCEHCVEEFLSKPDFKVHKKSQKLLCKKCQEKGTKFISENKCELIKHVKTVHKQELLMKKRENSLECKRCNKVLKTPKQLKTHQKTFSTLACTRCNQKLRGFCNLEIHLKTSCVKTENIEKVVRVEVVKTEQRTTKEIAQQYKPIEKKKAVPPPPPSPSPAPKPKPDDSGEKLEEKERSPLDNINFFYPTFTSGQLIEAGVFTADSPSHFTFLSHDSQMETNFDIAEQSDIPTYQETYGVPAPLICNEVILGF